jgi:hypothetical protein
MSALICWQCGESLDDLPRPISRHAHCPKCFTEVRCCRLCRHFDARIDGAQCAEERAEPPLNKEVANFCEWFDPRGGAFKSQRSARHDKARAELDALFGNPSENTDEIPPNEPQELSQEEQARAKLEALFSKKDR